MLFMLASAALAPLLAHCDPIAASHGACDSDIYKAVWQRFDSDTGQIFRADIASITPTGQRQGWLYVYSYAPGENFDPSKMTRIYLNCHGSYSDMDRAPFRMMSAPPRSVIGKIASIACPIIAQKEDRATNR